MSIVKMWKLVKFMWANIRGVRGDFKKKNGEP